MSSVLFRFRGAVGDALLVNLKPNTFHFLDFSKEVVRLDAFALLSGDSNRYSLHNLASFIGHCAIRP